MNKRSQYPAATPPSLTKEQGGKAPLAAKGAPNVLLADLREMIRSARQTVARAANAALVALYWKVASGYGQIFFKTSGLSTARRLL
jgi:hypothetical protein